MKAPSEKFLKTFARDVRLKTVDISYRANTGHVGSALSIADILSVLYTTRLRITKQTIASPNRDRFILSKGHAAAALYAVLYKKGILTKKQLESFGGDNGGLCEHPEIHDSGVEMSTGSLGHGVAFGVGIALGLQKNKSRAHAYVLVSDGELGEGAVWEAAILASRLKLDNLTVIVDYNQWQCFGSVSEVTKIEPLADKWQAFGWSVREVEGHDLTKLPRVFSQTPFIKGKPNLIVAHTVSGKGVSLIEDKLIGHFHVFTKDEYETARRQLQQS